MGSRVRVRLFDILHFVRDLLFPLLKNSKSGLHMVGTASLAPRWSAPLRDYPGAPPKKPKSFYLSLLKHLNADLKTELFLLQWIWFYSLLKSSYTYWQFLELYTVETGSVFDVFFRLFDIFFRARPVGQACFLCKG